jgi:hypothetical protein
VKATPRITLRYLVVASGLRYLGSQECARMLL